MRAVSNSTPLICLAALGDLFLIPKLIGKVAIPRAVHDEVVVNGQGRPGAREVAEATGDWISVEDVIDLNSVAEIKTRTGLQAGESEAIALAEQLAVGTVLIDDQQAVQEALSRNLIVVRTPALYLAAKRAGVIERVKPKLDALRAFGFHLREPHYQIILERAGEQ